MGPGRTFQVAVGITGPRKQWHDSFLKKKILLRTSSQGGGVGRYTLPPCTTKRKTTTNLKTKNSQNCQKIKLYGSPTTKELKKHSSRLVGGVGTGSWAERTPIEVEAGGVGSPTLACG